MITTSSYKDWESQLPIKKLSVRGIDINFSLPNAKSIFVAKNMADREPEVFDWIDCYVDNNSLFLDVGANFGQFTLYTALKKRCNIISFEPHFATYYILHRNIMENRLGNLVKIFPLAISNDFCSYDYFKLNDVSAGRALNTLGSQFDEEVDKLYAKLKGSTKNSYSAIQPVIKSTIDHLFDTASFNDYKKYSGIHLKIDVDGTELLVLLGTTNMLRYIKSIMVEYLPDSISSHRLIPEFLNQFGFTIKCEYKGNLLLTRQSN